MQTPRLLFFRTFDEEIPGWIVYNFFSGFHRDFQDRMVSRWIFQVLNRVYSEFPTTVSGFDYRFAQSGKSMTLDGLVAKNFEYML